jgi:hypothetical protein
VQRSKLKSISDAVQIAGPVFCSMRTALQPLTDRGYLAAPKRVSDSSRQSSNSIDLISTESLPAERILTDVSSETAAAKLPDLNCKYLARPG